MTPDTLTRSERKFLEVVARWDKTQVMSLLEERTPK
jgi:hypothetical protein